MVSIENFINKCNKGVCLRGTFKSKRCKLLSKQEVCYEKYIKKLEKDYKKTLGRMNKRYMNIEQKIKDSVDERWKEVKKVVWERDLGQCRLLKVLAIEEWSKVTGELLEIANTDLYKLDCAHVLGRGSNPKLKYNVNNVILMHRLFHGRLDLFKNPVTNENISKEQRNLWWIRIVGRKVWEELKLLKK